MGDRTPTWDEPRLFGDLKISVPTHDPGAPSLYQEHTLRFAWHTGTARGAADRAPEILPGMPLAVGQDQQIDAPGFAVLSFAMRPGDPPRFELQTACMETLLTSRWGEFLPDPSPDRPLPLTEAQAYGSSAGHVCLAYSSAHARPQAAGQQVEWQETFQLDGFVEIKNLVSWPTAIAYRPDANTLQLPPVGDDLTHLRHTIRVLFNQHTLPQAVPVFGRGALLFDLGPEPWQFPAVVEHRLCRVAVMNGAPALEGEQRWTAVQEVRICTPTQLATALEIAGDFKAQGSGAPGAPAAPLTLAAQNATDDLNQVVWMDPAGKPHVDLSEAGDKPWIGSTPPKPDAPPRHCYRVLRFYVKGVPRGARVERADLTLSLTGATEQKAPVRLQIHVANSVARDPLDGSHPVDPQQLIPYPDVVEITTPWTFPKPFALLDNLKSLVQVLVNRADWSADGAYVTVVVEGVVVEGIGSPGYTPQKRYASNAQTGV